MRYNQGIFVHSLCTRFLLPTVFSMGYTNLMDFFVIVLYNLSGVAVV